MDVLYARCAGLDIHRDTIVACVRLAKAGGVIRFVETFATTTTELERLSQWLTGHGQGHSVLVCLRTASAS
jgi:transposase